MAYNEDEETREVQHHASGSYDVGSLLPESALDLTVEQLLTLLVAKMMDRWDELEVVIVNSGRIKVVEFNIPPEYKGQVLGSKGTTIRALRTIAKAVLGPMVKQYSYHINLANDGPFSGTR